MPSDSSGPTRLDWVQSAEAVLAAAETLPWFPVFRKPSTHVAVHEATYEGEANKLHEGDEEAGKVKADRTSTAVGKSWHTRENKTTDRSYG